MINQFSRTELLIGEQALNKLHKSRVAVFGVGGVGGYVVEALARTGVGTLDLIDNDVVSLSNINRQIIATHSSIGLYKVDVAKSRIQDIQPDCCVNVYKVFYMPETENQFDFSQYDYIVDAIDTVKGKIALIENAKKANTPIISSMGAGNKMDPTRFRVSDISKTFMDPLAKVVRLELKKRGIHKVKVVWSDEPPMAITATGQEENAPGRRSTPGSIAFVPAAAGLVLASEIIRDLIRLID